MLNAFLAMPILLFIYSLLHHFPFSSPMILRLHSNALRDLGEMTRNWMRESVQRHFPLRSHSKHLAHRFGQGRLQLHNLSIVDFTPPQVHFQATKNSLLYMSTDGGTSQLDAQWSLQSDFLLSLIRSPAFAGSVRARIGGFSADVSIKIVERSHLAIHQCISRFDEFQLHLGGSLAADLIHWFHRPLAQALQSHVEETYCQLIGEKLLPWLHDQLAKLALKLHVDFGAELQLSQWLHSAKIGEGHLDLGMAQRLNQRGGEKDSRDRILAESLPLEMPTAKIGEKNGGHSLDLFLHESTLQQVFSGAHHSHQLRANFSSPFFRTNCPLLCLGKFVPQMRDALGPTQLLAVLRTNNPPNVRLFEQRIRLNLNASFELFLENWKNERGEGEKGAELMENYEGMEEEGNGQFDQGMDEQMEEEEFTEIEEEERERSIEVWKKGNDLDEEEEEEDGTLIRPKFIGVNGGGPRIIDFGQAKASTTTMSTIVFTEWTTRKGEMESTMSIGPISKKPKLPPFLGSHGEPILRIVLDSEMEILLELEKKRRRLKTELKLTKVRAVLTQSEVRNLSQKTIDLLVEASIPFLENSVRILYRDGIELDNLMAMPSGNESISIEDGFIRYSADVHLAQILQ